MDRCGGGAGEATGCLLGSVSADGQGGAKVILACLRSWGVRPFYGILIDEMSFWDTSTEVVAGLRETATVS